MASAVSWKEGEVHAALRVAGGHSIRNLACSQDDHPVPGPAVHRRSAAGRGLRSSPVRAGTPAFASRHGRTCSKARTSGAADASWPPVVLTLHAHVPSGPAAIVTSTGSFPETPAVIAMKRSSFTRTRATARTPEVGGWARWRRGWPASPAARRACRSEVSGSMNAHVDPS